MKKSEIVTLAILLLISLKVSAEEWDTQEYVPGEYVVQFKDATTMRLSEDLNMKAIDAKRGIYLLKRPMVERTESVLAQFRSDQSPNVAVIEPNYIYRSFYRPSDPLFETQSSLSDLNTTNCDGEQVESTVSIEVDRAWEIHRTAPEVIVAVIDTGISYGHSDLKENLWTNRAEADGLPGVDDDGNGYVDDIHGYNFVDNVGTADDDHGHGSHCAGVIGAKSDNHEGIAGINFEVQLMAVKFLSASGIGTLENAIKAIDYATQMGAAILSNSWGGGSKSQLLMEAIERARDAGALFVAAAGNDGKDNDVNPTYPASYEVDNVLPVAASTIQGDRAWFSNYGLRSVPLAAPGHYVYSTVQSGYRCMSGTSMAAPHVSGVAALALGFRPNLSYLDLKDLLVRTVRPIPSLKSEVGSGGVVNAYNLLREIE